MKERGAQMGGNGREGVERLWTVQFVLVIAVMLACSISVQGLNTGTTAYVEHEGGASFLSGLLAAVFSIAAAAARLAAGPFVDARGRGVAMVAGCLFLAVGAILPGALQGVTWSLVVGRTLQGIGFAVASTGAATAAADVLPSARLSEGIGYYGLAQAISTSIGPGFALFLVATNPAENLFFVLFGVAVFAGVLALACRYEKEPGKLPRTSAFRLRAEGALEPEERPQDQTRGVRRFLEMRAMPGALPQTVMSASYGFGIFFAGVYGESLGIENSGLYFTFAAVSMILVRLNSKMFLSTMLPFHSYGIAAGAAVMCALFLLASPLHRFFFYGAGLCYGLGAGIALPLNQGIAVKATPPERWGAANSTFLLSTDVGFGIACLTWGLVNDAFGYGTTIVCTLVCAAAAFALACVLYPPDAKKRS